MNCEGVRAVLDNGLEATTVAERNAAHIHWRTCQNCQAMVRERINAIPPKELLAAVVAATVAMANDNADPEWK